MHQTTSLFVLVGLSLALVPATSQFQENANVQRRRRSTGHSDHDEKDGGWGYDETVGRGPSAWIGDCLKTHQSPINIDTSKVEYNAALKAPTLTGYDQPVNDVIMSNNGHSVSTTLKPGMTLKLPTLDDSFAAKSFHFHWGRSNTVGSEHAINSKTFPMEMHIVHFNTKYGNVQEAVKHGDGLAVLAFLFTEGAPNRFFDPIINSLENVGYKGNSTSVSGFKLSDMIAGSSLNSYYRYNGSLTTPPCSEVVIWTVFSETLELSIEQLDEFHNHIDLDDHVRDNHRPVFPLGERVVYTGEKQLITPEISRMSRTCARLTVIVCSCIVGGIFVHA